MLLRQNLWRGAVRDFGSCWVVHGLAGLVGQPGPGLVPQFFVFQTGPVWASGYSSGRHLESKSARLTGVLFTVDFLLIPLAGFGQKGKCPCRLSLEEKTGWEGTWVLEKGHRPL